MCSTDCAYDSSTIILIGDVYCPSTKCWGKLCLHKKTFQSLGRSSYQCAQCASVCQVRSIPFEKQRNSSFVLSFGQGVYVFEESPKSIQDVIGDVYCSGEFCLNREKCEFHGGYVTTPRSIYGCGKCGALLFVHKVPFMLQEHVKTTKTDKARVFFVKKRSTWYRRNTCYLLFHFNHPNIERKKCVWTTKYKRLMEMCIVPHVETKSVYNSTNKTTSFYDCKKCNACCHVLNITFKDQKPTIMLVGGNGTVFFAKKSSRDYKKKNHLHF